MNWQWIYLVTLNHDYLPLLGNYWKNVIFIFFTCPHHFKNVSFLGLENFSWVSWRKNWFCESRWCREAGWTQIYFDYNRWSWIERPKVLPLQRTAWISEANTTILCGSADLQQIQTILSNERGCTILNLHLNWLPYFEILKFEKIT